MLNSHSVLCLCQIERSVAADELLDKHCTPDAEEWSKDLNVNLAACPSEWQLADASEKFDEDLSILWSSSETLDLEPDTAGRFIYGGFVYILDVEECNGVCDIINLLYQFFFLAFKSASLLCKMCDHLLIQRCCGACLSFCSHVAVFDQFGLTVNQIITSLDET